MSHYNTTTYKIYPYLITLIYKALLLGNSPHTSPEQWTMQLIHSIPTNLPLYNNKIRVSSYSRAKSHKAAAAYIAPHVTRALYIPQHFKIPPQLSLPFALQKKIDASYSLLPVCVSAKIYFGLSRVGAGARRASISESRSSLILSPLSFAVSFSLSMSLERLEIISVHIHTERDRLWYTEWIIKIDHMEFCLDSRYFRILVLTGLWTYFELLFFPLYIDIVEFTDLNFREHNARV